MRPWRSPYCARRARFWRSGVQARGLDAALRAGAERLKIKAGQMFQPIRVAVCGRKERAAFV